MLTAETDEFQTWPLPHICERPLTQEKLPTRRAALVRSTPAHVAVRSHARGDEERLRRKMAVTRGDLTRSSGRRASMDGQEADPGAQGLSESAYGESRWPMAAAVLATMVLTVLLPDDLRLAPRWVLPTVEGLLLVALIAGDPGRISRRSTALRAASVALISVLALSAIWSTIQLIDDLVHGGPETNSASALLQAGGNVWACTVLAFSLLYFELD